MTKEEMFKEMKEMEPVLGRGGIDIVLGKRIPGSFSVVLPHLARKNVRGGG